MILDILYQVLASPVKAFQQSSEKKPLSWAILTSILTSVTFSLTLLPNPPELVESIFGMEKGSFNLILAIVICALLYLALLFIGGGIIHLVAILFQGWGNYLGIVCGLCFAWFPLVFIAPLTFLRALFGSSGNTLYPIASSILFLWIFVLEIIAIRQNYNLSLKKAVATYFIPFTILIIMPLLIATIIILI